MDPTENGVRLSYDPAADRPLSDAVLEAIAEAKGEDLTKENCVLYDDIDPSALDNLFRSSGNGNTAVMFDSLDVGVTLLGDGEIEIRAIPLADEADVDGEELGEP